MAEAVTSAEANLLNAFRSVYTQLLGNVENQLFHPTDSTVLARIGDELEEYHNLLVQHSHIFDEPELSIVRTNVSLLQQNVRQAYHEYLDQSHHGHPTVIETVHTGNRGRPSFHIDLAFLHWAYNTRSISSIGRFLGISRGTVRTALLECGLAQPLANPFPDMTENNNDTASETTGTSDNAAHDFVLDPVLPSAINLTSESQQPILQSSRPVVSYTGPLSSITDEELDALIIYLRQHFTRIGITMIHGMLRRLGYRIPRTRITQSLYRIDPVHRVFGRIRIRRRSYSVAGPNALWHHDGQHGLIRWGIVIHGFVDGYSRLITALHASNNNTGQTVLNLFLEAAQRHGVPSRLRGDHGVENILVAAWLENFRGTERGSYIWGRSVHNIRIERLWVDVTAQIGASWAEAFTDLEINHGLDINNTRHIWLLHFLFLQTLNQQLSFFAESWNYHQIQIRGGPNRSPIDMFSFDMLVHGVRGDWIAEDNGLTDEELEVYGVDWEALQDERILRSARESGQGDEGISSWGQQPGPPRHLNEVPVLPPEGPATDDLAVFSDLVAGWIASTGAINATIPNIWAYGLATAHTMYGNMF